MVEYVVGFASDLDHPGENPEKRRDIGSLSHQGGKFFVVEHGRAFAAGGLNGSAVGLDIDRLGDPHLAFSIAGESKITPTGAAVTVADAYVPAGSMMLSLRDASGFKAVDRVQIIPPVKPEWLPLMGMVTLARDCQKQTSVAGNFKSERSIGA